MQAIFHLGFDKTGSSSIQRFLCEAKFLHSTTYGHKYQYAIITENSELIYGKALSKLVKRSVLGYQISYPDIAVYADHDKIRKQILAMNKKNIVPIFSCEGWARKCQLFIQYHFFERLNLDCQIIAFIRPQPLWLNSAWWQWHAWDNKIASPEQFFLSRRGRKNTNWHGMLEQWRAIQGKTSLHVEVMSANVIDDLCSVFNIDDSQALTDFTFQNKSLSTPLIKLLRTYPEFRSVHDSAVDLKLEQLLGSSEGSPWVISPELLAKIIELTTPPNKKLLQHLSPDNQEKMINDIRWWSIDGYQDKSYTPLESLFLSENEKDTTITKLLSILLNR